jgi:hypothetical protein
MRTVISVQQGDLAGAQCSSVVAAVLLVKPGVPTTITISAGTYVEASPLCFDSVTKDLDVELVALGDGLPTITTQSKSPLRISSATGSKISFHGLKFESNDELAPAVLILSGEPKFTECSLQSVHVDGDAEPVIQNCVISDSRSNGIAVCGKAGGQYLGNIVKLCPLYGILIDSSSSTVLVVGAQISLVGEGCLAICGSQSAPQIQNCIFEDAQQNVSKYGDSTESAKKVKHLVVSDMRAYVSSSHSVRAAVIVANNSAPKLSGNTIFRCQSHGVVAIANWSPARIVNTSTVAQFTSAPTPKKKGNAGNAVQNALPAVQSPSAAANTAQCRAEFSHSQIRDNSGYGIYIMEGVTIDSHLDVVERNELGGVFVASRATLTMKGSSVGGTKSAIGVTVMGVGTCCSLIDVEFSETLTGIVAEDGAQLECTAVKFNDAEIGIVSRSRSRSMLTNSQIANCTTGIRVEEYAVCRIENTRFEMNTIGIAALDHGVPEVSTCTFRRNVTAIDVSDSAGGFVMLSTIADSTGLAQVDCTDFATTSFVSNIIELSNELAVRCSAHARPLFSKNTFLNSRGPRVVSVGSFCDPTFTENSFIVDQGHTMSHERDILVVEEDGVGTYSGNKFCEAQHGAGIVVCRGAVPTISFNTITGNLVGILVQSGGEGLFEKNDIRSSIEANVRVLGDGELFVVPSFSRNCVTLSRLGFDCSDNSNPLFSRNLIAQNSIGVLCRQKSCVTASGNDIVRNHCGVLVHGAGTCGTFFGNTIRENTVVGVELQKDTNATFLENSFVGHFAGNDEFEGASLPSHFSSERTPKKAKLRLRALRIVDDCYGSVVANRFAFNDIGVEFQSFDNHCIVMANVFSDNLCGLWARFAKSEVLLGFQPTIIKKDDFSTASICGGVFINNGIGVAAVGNMKVDVDFCVFHSNRLAGATITGRLPDTLFSLCVFSHGGLTNLTIKGDVQQEPVAASEKASLNAPNRRIEQCVFYGCESSVAVQRHAKDIEIDSSLFVSCSLVVSSGAAPDVRNSHFIGSTTVLTVTAACSSADTVSYVTDPTAISLLQETGGGKVRQYLPQISVTKKLFTLDRGIVVESSGGGMFANCFVSFAKEGIVLDGTTESCLFEDTVISRCLQSGIVVGSWGFGGQMHRVTSFRNFAAGVRLRGKCTSSSAFVRCDVVCHLAEPLLDAPTTQKSIIDALKRVTFPDNTDDKPFAGVEKTPDLHVDSFVPPTYICPETDGVGVGLLIHSSAVAELRDCTFARNSVANLIVETKNKCTFSCCSSHASEGFGCVVRKECTAAFSECHFTTNYFAGALNELDSNPEFRRCTFFANTIGLIGSSDYSLADDCQFLRNKVCGVRTVKASKSVLTRCSFQENAGAGIECRGGSPNIAYSNFDTNGCCGVLSTSASASPSVDGCRFSLNPFGMLFRSRSAGVVKNSYVCDNRTGLTCRMGAHVVCSENTFRHNVVGVAAEWESTGDFQRNHFVEQRERSVLCVHGANPAFRFNIHTRDAPVCISQQGRGTFTQCTFRVPLHHCFIVATAGDPVISYCRFCLIHGSENDLVRAGKIQERDPAQMRAPVQVSAPLVRRTSSKFLSSSHRRSFSFPVDDGGGGAPIVGPQSSSEQFPPTGGTGEEIVLAVNRKLSRTREAKSHKMFQRASIVVPRRKSSVSQAALVAPARATTQLEQDLDDESLEFNFESIPVRCEQGAMGTINNCIFAHNGPASIFCTGAGTCVFIANNLFFDHRGCAVIVANDAAAIIRRNLFMRNTLGLHLSHCDKRTRVERCTFYQNITSVDATEGCCGTLVACKFLEDHVAVDCSANSETIISSGEFLKCDYAICGDCNISLEVINSKVMRTVRGCFVFDGAVPVDDSPDETKAGSAESILAERRRKPQTARTITFTDIEVFGSQDSVLLSGANALLKMTRCKLLFSTGSAVVLPRMNLTTVSRTVLGSTTLTDCVIDGANCGVLAASNVRHRLVIQNTTFRFCEVALETQTYESNLTVSGCTVTQCDMGVSIERGTAMIRHTDLSACRIGVSFSAGDERNPVVCKSQIFDCSEIGCRLCEGSCGVVSLNDIFDCGTCVEFEQDATTELSHCTISHPSDSAAKIMSMSSAKRKPRVFDETLTLKQGFSPLHRERNVRQRAAEYETKKAEHEAARLKLSETTDAAEASVAKNIELFLGGLGMTLTKLQTLPFRFVASDGDMSTVCLTPEPFLVEAQSTPQKTTSFYKEDDSSPVSITPHETRAPVEALKAPPGADEMTLPTLLAPSQILAAVAMRSPSGAREDLLAPQCLVLQKPVSNLEQSGRRLSTANRRTEISELAANSADVAVSFVDNPLPPLEHIRAGESFPTTCQRTRLIQDSLLIPPMPKNLELFFLQQPQVEKFMVQSAKQLEQFAQFSRCTNILFAEQAMQAFHVADRRRVRALSLDDVTHFFVQMVREYQRGSLRAELDEHDHLTFDESQYDIRPRILFPSFPGAEQVDDTGRPTKLWDSVRMYVIACAQQCGINILETDLLLRDFVRLVEYRPSDASGREKLFYAICRDYFSWMEKLTPGKELSDASVRPFQPPPQLPSRGERHR